PQKFPSLIFQFNLDFQKPPPPGFSQYPCKLEFVRVLFYDGLGKINLRAKKMNQKSFTLFLLVVVALIGTAVYFPSGKSCAPQTSAIIYTNGD
ncbi:MAG: hypothetical protein AAB897_01385, partial [Patescibacteria group bacterium]